MVAIGEALSSYGVPLPVRMIISTSPESFLYPGLLSALVNKTTECATILADIISKSDMLVAPGNTIDELEEVIG